MLHKIKKIALIVGSLFFILAYPFLLLPYGLDFTDAPYHFSAYTGQRPPDVMTFFYAIPGKLWLSVFPNSVWSLRVFGTLFWMAMHIVPAWIVLRRVQVPLLQVLPLLSLGVLVAWAIPRVQGFDLIANGFGAFLFTGTALYLLDKKNGYLPILGVLAAFFVASRLPNILVLLPITIIVAWVVYSSSGQKKAIHTIYAILLFLFSFFGAFFFLYAFFGQERTTALPGSVFQDFLMHIQNKQAGLSPNYHISALLKRYFIDTETVGKTLAFLSVLAITWKTAAPKSGRWEILVRIALLTSFSYYMYCYTLGTTYGWGFSLFASAFVLAVIGLAAGLAFLRKEVYVLPIALVAVSFGWISAVGSNTGLYKMLWSYSYILPVVAYYPLCHLSVRDKHFFISLLVGLGVFALIEHTLTGYRYQDDHWYRLQHEAKHPKLRGIYTGSLRADQIDEVLAQVQQIKKRDPEATIFFHGKHAWLFRYVEGTKNLYPQTFHMNFDNPKEADLLRRHITSSGVKPYVCLVYGYGENTLPRDPVLIGGILENQGYALYAQGNNYEIYAPAALSK